MPPASTGDADLQDAPGHVLGMPGTSGTSSALSSGATTGGDVQNSEDIHIDNVPKTSTMSVKKSTATLRPILESAPALPGDAHHSGTVSTTSGSNCAAGLQLATVQPVPIMYPPATDEMCAVYTGYVQQVFVPDGTPLFCQWASSLQKSTPQKWYMMIAGDNPSDWQEVPADMLQPRPIHEVPAHIP